MNNHSVAKMIMLISCVLTYITTLSIKIILAISFLKKILKKILKLNNFISITWSNLTFSVSESCTGSIFIFMWIWYWYSMSLLDLYWILGPNCQIASKVAAFRSFSLLPMSSGNSQGKINCPILVRLKFSSRNLETLSPTDAKAVFACCDFIVKS